MAKNRSERRRESVPAADPRLTPVASIADRALNDIARSVQVRLRASAVVIAVELDGQMTCRARAGAAAPEIGTPVQRDRGVTGECVTTGAVIRCPDTGSDQRVDAALCEQLRIRSILLVPLLRHGHVIGVVEAFFPTRYGFDDRAVQVLQEVASEIVTRICGEDKEPVATPALLPPVALAASPDIPAVDLQVQVNEAELPAETSSPAGQPIAFDTPEAEPAYAPAPKFHLENEHSAPTRKVAAALAVLVVLAISAILYERLNSVAPIPATTHAAAQAPPNQTTDPLAELRQEAQAGDAAAQYKIAQAYKSGSGVAADPQQANAWLETAAEHGNSDAQLEWARTLETSEDADLVQAYTWYVIAGQAGKTESERAIRRLTPSLSPADIAQVRYRVGETILAGRALRRDPIAAYVWFALSEWGGNANARTPVQQLEAQLTPIQLREAKSRASAWIRRHSAPVVQKTNPPATASR